MSEQNFELATTQGTESYCSLVPANPKEAAVLFNAISNPEHRLSEYINKTIYVRDVYAETISCLNEKSGEYEPTKRIVLIDKDMKSYQCVSIGVYQAVRRLISMYGNPTWNQPIPVTVKSIEKGAKRILSLEIEVEKMK